MDLDFIDEEARLKYRLRRKLDLDRCRKLFGSGDFEAIQTIGHNLKGNGISFGFPELSILGEKLEFSAKELNIEQIKSLIDSLETWIQQQEQLEP